MARPAGTQWLHLNGNWDGTRYSTLSDLNPCNASELKVKWVYSTGAKTDTQATPIYHDGLLYFPQDNSIHAIDASTGARVWKFDHELPEDWGGQFIPFFTGKHRGVAISGNKVWFLSNDCTLYGLHYKSGEVLVNLKIDRPYPKDFEMSSDGNGYFCTSGPLAIPGIIIVPMNATDTGGLQGYVHGHDAETGERLWAANMIPAPGEPGADTWPGDSRIYGGAGPWIVGSWDPELKMYFTGTANAYPWSPYSDRKGRGGGDMANEGAAAIVAVNTDTGKVAWRYTVTPGDPWDYDAMQTPMLHTINGRRTIIQPNKTGYIHYLDAATGKYLMAPQFADKITWANGYNSNGLPNWAQTIPPEGEEIIVWPSLLGGTNMYPSALNPKTGMMYLARQEAKMAYTLEKVQVVSNVRNLGAAFEILPGGIQTPSANRISDGSEVWRITISKAGFPGGMLTTAGNLTIFATAGGTVYVTNATTGEVVYNFSANSTSKSGPLTYAVGGKQQITFAFGGLPTFSSAPEDNPVNNSGIMVTFAR